MGGTAVSTVQVNQNDLITLPSSTKTGYTLTGWYRSNDLGVTNLGLWNFATDVVTGDLTLFALWTINQYTITFNMNGAEAIAPIVDDYQADVTPPTRPSRVDFRFGGWFADAELTIPFTFPSTMPATDIQVYAKWLNSIKPKDIRMGNRFAIGLSENGQLFAWGSNQNNQLGNAQTNQEAPNPIPIVVNDLLENEHFVQIAVANQSAMALTNQHRVFGWGRNANMRLGFFNSSNNVTTPTLINFSNVLDQGEMISEIFLREGGGFALTSTRTKLIGWGTNDEYRLGIDEPDVDDDLLDFLPTIINLGLLAGETIQQFVVGTNHNLLLTSQHRLIGWGGNNAGQLGRSNATWTINTPTDIMDTIALNQNEQIRLIITNNDARSSILVTSTERVLVSGNNSQGLLGTGNTTAQASFVPISLPALNPNETIVKGTISVNLTNLVTSDNRLLVSGRNSHGQLGLPATTSSSNVFLINDNVPLLENESILTIHAQVGSDTLGFVIITTSLGRSFGWGDLRYDRHGNSQIIGAALFTPTLLEI